ncbi:unnamed protein product [Durusdinium trenchii]|uniref:Coiled-coil domain-containing protein 167 n=1 Tax=Durusdinium trenchii TaxID=1381693 RepID=A0ABP0NIB6_9DINO
MRERPGFTGAAHLETEGLGERSWAHPGAVKTLEEAFGFAPPAPPAHVHSPRAPDARRELTKLRMRCHQLEGDCKRLEDENAQLKAAAAERAATAGSRASSDGAVSATAAEWEETCHQLEEDLVHLKRALKEREEGEKSLRRLLADARSLNRKSTLTLLAGLHFESYW